MICVLNRRELLITRDQREVNRICEMFLANQIEFQVKVSDPGSVPSLGSGRTRTASFGMLRKQKQFTVYVHKNDWEYAAYLLRNNRV